MHDAGSTIGQFLNATAARQPTPGGGAVACLTAALAAALGEMVVNYSLNKKELAAYSAEFRPALETLAQCRSQLTQAISQDQLAYEAMTAARRLPAGSPERKTNVTKALRQCISAPADAALTTVAILEACDKLVSLVNIRMLSDLAVCSDLAMAAIRCCVYTARINLAELEDAEERLKIETAIGEMLKRAVALIQNIAPRIWNRHAQGV
jgi:methenyltetrahydrofolate cyclohydrolase